MKYAPKLAPNYIKFGQSTTKILTEFSVGFNINRSHKALINLPPLNITLSLIKPWQGAYVWHSWPGFTFLPGLNLPDNDVKNVGSKENV